jgi:hypothetical protein
MSLLAKQLRKAAVAVRKEFKGRGGELEATIALMPELKVAHPILKEKGYDFAEVTRRGKKLRVLFV